MFFELCLVVFVGLLFVVEFSTKLRCLLELVSALDV